MSFSELDKLTFSSRMILIISFYCFTGVQEEQHMTMTWLQIRGANIRNRSLDVPISGPKMELAWVGLTDRGSPTVMDDDGVIAIFDGRSSLWNVACDTANQVDKILRKYNCFWIFESLLLTDV